MRLKEIEGILAAARRNDPSVPTVAQVAVVKDSTASPTTVEVVALPPVEVVAMPKPAGWTMVVHRDDFDHISRVDVLPL